MLSATKKLIMILLVVEWGVSDIFAQTLGKPISTIEKGDDQNQITPVATTAPVATPLPNLMILPWQTPSIDADMLRQTKTARSEAMAIIKRIVAPNAVDLATIAPAAPKLESARYTLKNVLADATASNPTPVAILPVWARMHDHDLFALVIIDSRRNTLKSVIHRVIPRSVWEDSARSKNFATYFTPGYTEISNAVNLASISASKEDASVAIRDQTASPRSNEIDRLVMAVLIGSNLIPEFTVINPFANELLVTIHQFYGLNNSMRKANREIITRITYDSIPVKVALPLKLTLNIRATDGVFGQTLPWSWSEPLTIGVKPDNTIDLQLSDRLKTELKKELESLRRDELPQVAKIRGAWAYVDKGRAWGLQMNDRLVSQENPADIKGHVVAYFGPEMNLKSPRGWPIHEGAIVFVRKGQKSLRVGQTFTYDAMKVPTSWPPTAPTGKP